MSKAPTPAQKLTIVAAVGSALLVGGIVLVRDALGRLVHPEGSKSKARESGDRHREPLASPTAPFRPVTALSLFYNGSQNAKHKMPHH